MSKNQQQVGFGVFAFVVGALLGGFLLPSSAAASPATYCEHDHCVQLVWCYDAGAAMTGCNKTGSSTLCETYLCGET